MRLSFWGFVLAIIVSAITFTSSTVLAGANKRVVTISNFDDGGLSSGNHDIIIYLPKDYSRSNNHYPVIYFSDGEGLFSFQHKNSRGVDRAVDSLVKDRLIDPVIIVGIANHANGRTFDLTPTVGDPKTDGYPAGGGQEGFYKFIAQRLKPYIDTNFRTKTDPVNTGIAGSSFGGLTAFMLAYNHPDTFGMAGCMSPSFWWDHQLELKAIANDGSSKKNVRIWLDAGMQEYYMWTTAEKACALLKQKGWTTNDDVATYLDYTGAHNDVSWSHRMRWMFYFLLHKQPLQFQGYRLVPAWNPTKNTLELDKGHAPIIAPEALYAHGLRLNVADPSLTSKDSKVATIDGSDPLEIRGAGPGQTSVSSTFQGVTASLDVKSYDLNRLPHPYICPKTDLSHLVDGDLSDWPSLPYVINDPGKLPIAYFGTAYDDKNIYVGIHVIDQSIVASVDVKPWQQDSVVIQFDARPEPALREGDEGWDAPDYLLVEISPGKLDHPLALSTNINALPKDMQDETKIESVTAPGGYNVEVSFPVSYLDQRQSPSWKEFRLNVGVSKADKAGGNVTEIFWQPLWGDWGNIIGSGMFERGPDGVAISKTP